MDTPPDQESSKLSDEVTNKVQKGFVQVQKSVQASNIFPAGASYETFRTFSDFNNIVTHLHANIIDLSNKILRTETTRSSLKKDFAENDDNMEKIVQINDEILDRINTNIDTECGLRKSDYNIPGGIKMTLNDSWRTQPQIAEVKMGSTTLIAAKNIPRPQINFKDAIDNSPEVWVPKITDKPNSIKPLALQIIFGDDDEPIGYEHPYQVELDKYQPPKSFLKPEELIKIPLGLEETNYTYIDKAEQIEELVKHLCSVNEMAVDLEHHSYRTYQGFTCLMQITTEEGGDFVIDTLALREHMHQLNLVFTNPKILKVFHGADCDIVWLQRDFGLYVVGLFDTYRASKTLKLPRLSLKHLLAHYCQVDADKKYQLADWRMRPLPEELIKYARMDTHNLLYIWRRMKMDLLDAACGNENLLVSVFEQSRHVCLLTYNKPIIKEDSHKPVYLRSKKSFNKRQMEALKMLFRWRDNQARSLDESTSYLMPDHMLLALSENLPREMQGINACCSPMPPFIKQNLVTIHRMILVCRDIPLETQMEVPANISAFLNQQQPYVHSFHDFSHSPDFRDDLPSTKIDFKMLKNCSNYESEVPALLHKRKMADVDFLTNAYEFIPPYKRYVKYRALDALEQN